MVKIWKALSLFALLSLFAYAEASAQTLDDGQFEEIRKIEDTLLVLGFTVINDSLPEQRFGACREMIPALVRALKVENSFHYPFNRLKSVSIQYPSDSTFRIFTWQLYVDENDYRYYGAIQMNSPDLKLYPLVDRSFQIENVEFEALPPEKWYGAVYYNLKELASADGNYYLLFGFDGYEFFRKRKVLEVLHFDAGGKPVFGAPVIPGSGEGGPTLKNRLCLEYSAEASIRLNYDAALDMIIFDHLITAGGQYGEGPVNVPDGSYEAFRIENGRLFHVDKVWNQVSDEPPRPMPILDGKKKDIIGNQ